MIQITDKPGSDKLHLWMSHTIKHKMKKTRLEKNTGFVETVFLGF